MTEWNSVMFTVTNSLLKRLFIKPSKYLPFRLKTHCLGTMLLGTVVKNLESFAPLELAAHWDNVGLLVEPTPPHHVRLILCTIDLTETVMKEAVGKRVDMIISYHPPIFKALTRLTQSNWKERILTKAIENRIAVYSPHTSLDSVYQGVNDWLLSCFCDGIVTPIKTYSGSLPGRVGQRYKIGVLVDKEVKEIRTVLNSIEGCVLSESTDSTSGVQFCLDAPPTSEAVICVMEKLRKWNNSIRIEVQKTEELPQAGYGEGRILRLTTPMKIADVLQQVKTHLHLDAVRLALGIGKFQNSEISTIAVCAGSGGGVLNGVAADVYLTGEMSHHDVLNATAQGITVILCEHSNTERGYLKSYASRVLEICKHEVDVIVSEADRDPLQIV